MSNRHRRRGFARSASPRTPNADIAPEPADGTIVVGRVIRPHGLDGTLRIQPHSDNPARFQAGSLVTVAEETWVVVSYQTLPDRYALLRLEGLDSADAVVKMAGQWLIAPEDPAPDLPDGEFYHYQLVGLAVVTDEGEHLGNLQEVLVTGSNDVYVVVSDTGNEILLPAVSQVIREVDLASKRVLVHLIDGLR